MFRCIIRSCKSTVLLSNEGIRTRTLQPIVAVVVQQQRCCYRSTYVIPTKGTLTLPVLFHRRSLTSHSKDPSSTSTTNLSSSSWWLTVTTTAVSTVTTWYALRLETHPYIVKGMTSGIIAATGDFTCQYLLHCQQQISSSTSSSTYDSTTGTTHDQQSNGISQQQQSWWDASRTLRFGVLGAFYVAPGCHIWYNQLARWFPVVVPNSAKKTNVRSGSSMIPVLKRVILDQFVFTPIFLVGWLTSLLTLESYMTKPTTTTSTIVNPPNDKNNYNHNFNGSTNTVLQQYYKTIVVDHSIMQILYSNWMLWIPVQACNFYYIPTKYQVLISNAVSFVWNMYLSYKTTTNTNNNASTQKS
jgi:Mpv17 / PMP22 family